MDNETINEYKCKDCQEVFTMTESDERFFTDKGLYIPKRCKPCRLTRRENKNQ